MDASNGVLFGASVYTFSLILAVFLSGLAIGGVVGSRLGRRASDARSTLGVVHVSLAVAIAFGAWAIVNVLPGWQPTAQFLPNVRATPSLAFAFDALRCAFALLPATILWGASFPLTLACGARDFSRYVARINAINTAGASPARCIYAEGIPLLGIVCQQGARRFAHECNVLFGTPRRAPKPARSDPALSRVCMWIAADPHFDC